jgi:diguanylate cyclase (GGDEF)-like protein/PAS domain S-box-containing protein
MPFRPLWISALLVGLVFSAKAFSQTLTPITVQVNWNHQFQFAGFYAAIKQGYYQNAGLDVTVKSWKPGTNMVNEVVNGRADFATAYSSVIVDYAKGAPIKLVMSSFQFSPMVLLAHKPVEDLKDMSGMDVMHFSNLQIQSLINKANTVTQKPLKSIPPSGDLNDFINHRVDLYGAYMTNEPFRLQQEGIPYYAVDPKTFGVQSYGDLIITSERFANRHPEVVQRFKEATIRGWRYALQHQPEVVDYILAHYPVVKSREALLNEAKVTVHYVKSGLTPIGTIEPAKLLATAAEAKEVGLISASVFNQLDMKDFIFNAASYVFTPEELAYIEQNPVVYLANDIDWEPFEFIDSKGRYRGIAAEYFQLLSQKTGLRFQVDQTRPWAEVLKLAQEGEYDAFSCAVATPERSEYMQFTEPYLSFPMVLVGQKELSVIPDYEQLNGHTVAVVKGYWSHETLAKNYPHIKLLPVNSVKEGLEAVIDGRAMVYSGNLGAINYAINKYGLTGIHVIGQSEHRFELAIGVRKDKPALFSILRKGLASISDEERREIFNHWIQLEMVNRLDKRQLFEVALVILVVVLTMLFLVMFYRYQKNKQQVYINQIHELTYATLIDLESLTFDWVSESYCRLTGYNERELLGRSYLDLAAHDLPKSKQDYIQNWVLAGRTWRGEMEGRTADDKPYWVELTLTPVRNLWGRVDQVWATRVDISDRKRIEQISITDDLTDLYNRRYFNQVFGRELKRSQRDAVPLSVAMLDIDFFKKINDHYGHQKGDEVLKQVADLLKKHFARETDVIFRMGGEEFFVLANFKSQAALQEHLQDLCRDVEGLKVRNESSQHGYLTISVGAAFLQPQDLSGTDQVYHLVDEALYAAKQQGRNQVVMVKPDAVA